MSTNIALNQLSSNSISVVDRGADSTGVSDSTAAIQDAINNFSIVYFPPGTYKVTSTITISSTTIIYSDFRNAATINFVSPNTTNKQMFVISATDVRIQGVSIQYTSVINESAQIFDIRADGFTVDDCHVYGDTTVAKPNTLHAFLLGSADFKDFTVRNCEINNVQRVFIRSNSSTNDVENVLFDGNYVHDLNEGGVQFNFPNGSINWVRVSNNHFKNFLQGSEQIFTGGASLKNATFSGNTFEGTAKECIHLEEDGVNISITGNVFNITDLSGTENLRGIFITDNNVEGTFNQPENITITGNTFSNVDVSGTGTYTGIQASNDGTGINSLERLIITGNTFENYDRGIHLDYGEYVVSNNIIRGCGRGVYVDQAKPDIYGNSFIDCTTAIESISRGGIVGKNTYRNCTTVAASSGDRLTLNGFVLLSEADVVVADTATVNTDMGIDLGANGDMDGNCMISVSITSSLYKNRLSALNWDGATLTDTQTYLVGSGSFTATLVNNSGELAIAVNNTTGAQQTVKGMTLDFNGFYTSNS